MAALQGLCACDVDNNCTYTDNAEMAVKMADALLKELSNES